ncbi:amino acid adenylation domain-containing protein [Ruegeria sp. HKCCA5014]|uniref:amino acid adenylation domain-containing protein n=2 Tax=Ruegeria TaxID=97050 RepID=UPI003530087C
MMAFLDDTLGAHAVVQPEKPAFIFKDKTLSFAELHDHSDALAAQLRALGLERGARIGVFFYRSLEVPVAVFGSLKAATTFVPLDPHAPTERLAHIVNSTDMSAIITSDVLATKAEEIIQKSGVDCLVLGPTEAADTCKKTISWSELVAGSQRYVTPDRVDTDLAYIIFTSGSTGEPKGIMHSHRTALGYLDTLLERIDIGRDDVMCALSPLIFDMSLNEYFGGPVCGASVVIAADGQVKLPASLGPLFEKHGVSIYCSVPSLLVSFLERGSPENADLSAIRWVLTGGEPLAAKHLRSALDAMPNAQYGNLYGPTETNSCSVEVITRENSDNISSIPIGRMGRNSRALIIDENDVSVPVGETGELCVQAASVMMGYWGKTESKDIVFLERYGPGGVKETYYRTGDQVRINESGTLHYLGRTDRLVKIRGYRVELDEVEAALNAQDDVAEAAAISFCTADNTLTIGAAVLLSPGSETCADDLHRAMSDVLPSYARPSLIEILPELPRTASQKISRRGLEEIFQNHQGFNNAQ